MRTRPFPLSESRASCYNSLVPHGLLRTGGVVLLLGIPPGNAAGSNGTRPTANRLVAVRIRSGQVAQVVERSPEKAGVGGSTPSLATIIPKNLAQSPVACASPLSVRIHEA